MPEIARAAGIWPKFFGGYWARHPKKFSLALLRIIHTVQRCSLYFTYVLRTFLARVSAERIKLAKGIYGTSHGIKLFVTL